jgi:hypothetical protein
VKLFEAYKEAWTLVPELSQDEILAAVNVIGRSRSVTAEKLQWLCGTPEKLQRLRININASFHSYMREQLWHAAGEPPSDAAKHLKRIAKQTAKLIEALGACDDFGAGAFGCLALQAARYGERIGGYPRLPPREFVVADTDPIVRRIDYRGEEKVEEIIEGLALLHKLAEDAHRYERAKVGKGKADNCPPAAPVMRTFFHDLHRAWLGAFGVKPKTSLLPEGEAGGPYIRFVSKLLKTYREKIPAEIDTYAPELRDSLDLSPGAIRGHVRQAQAHLESPKRNCAI